jgi:hypothetical protein
MKQIVRAWRQLQDFGLITVVREYSYTVYRAEWHHPSDFKFPGSKSKAKSRDECPKQVPQTPTPSSSIKDIEDNKQTPVVVDSEFIKEEELRPEDEATLKTFHHEATSLGIKTHEGLKSFVQNYSWGQIFRALAVVKEKVFGHQPPANPTGLFREALKRGWVPNSLPDTPPIFPDGWSDWLARFASVIHGMPKVNSLGLVSYEVVHPDPLFAPRRFFFPLDNLDLEAWLTL